VCHLRNDVTARFCRDCGLPLGAPRDPVRGTTTRRADLPSDRGTGIAAIVSLAAIVVIAGLAGFLVLRGFESATTSAVSSASAPPSGASTSGDPGGTTATDTPASPVVRQPSNEPAGTPAADPTLLPTEDPGAETTQSPDESPTEGPTERPLSTRTSWTCRDAAIQDPLEGRWRILQVRWGRMDGFDRLTFDLGRLDGQARRGAIVRMAFMKPGRAASRYDVDTPMGDRALVLTFDGSVNLRRGVSATPPIATVGSVVASTDADGVVHAIIGVKGDGCARIVANDWRNGSDETTAAKLVIDIRR
jgi:hypothetical protein